MDEEEDLNCNEDIDHYPIWDLNNDIKTYVDADVDADEETYEPLQTIMEMNGSTAIMEDIELETEADFEETNEDTALLQQQQQQQEEEQHQGPQPPQEMTPASASLSTAATDSVSKNDLNQSIVVEHTRTNRHNNRAKEMHSGSSDSG